MHLTSAHEAISVGGSGVSYAVSAAVSAADPFWLDEGLTPEHVQEAIRAELLPWALGLRDPLRERVETRRA